MELLVLKSGDKYLRITELSFEHTGMSKASVYPISDFDKVKAKYNLLKDELKNLSIKKLTITESDFIE